MRLMIKRLLRKKRERVRNYFNIDGGKIMKYIKITAIMFIVTVGFALVNVNAARTNISFVDVNINSLSRSTDIYNAQKNNFQQQSAKKHAATDNLSGDGRAMKGKVDNSSWLTLADGGKLAKWTEELTYFAGNYTHSVKATKSTLSTVSYWGSWYWDVNGVSGLN